jgi:hypothetical protein
LGFGHSQCGGGRQKVGFEQVREDSWFCWIDKSPTTKPYDDPYRSQSSLVVVSKLETEFRGLEAMGETVNSDAASRLHGMVCWTESLCSSRTLIMGLKTRQGFKAFRFTVVCSSSATFALCTISRRRPALHGLVYRFTQPTITWYIACIGAG